MSDVRKVKNHYLDEIIGLLPGHVYWKDLDGVYLGCNEMQAISAGLPNREAIIGKTDYDMPWHDQADILRRIDAEVIRTGIAQTIEEPSVLADGTEAIFLSKKVPLYRKNKIIGIVGISFDVTEQRKTEKKLVETQHIIDGLTLISASMAHELRTPLGGLNISIKVIANVLESISNANSSESEVSHDEVYSILDREVAAMAKEIRASLTCIDMLLLNLNPKLESSKIETFSINHCISETLRRYPFTGNHHILVKWQKNEESDFLVKGQPELIIHTMFNLLKNALYYILKKGDGDIKIWVEPGKDYNQLFFHDSGTGISASSLPKIFDRFYSKTHRGAGIGLTFCKWVMENLGGDITCESIEGEYTLFILKFPHAKNVLI